MSGPMAGLDRIVLRGIRARGHHGVFPHERRDGQEFVVDVVLGVSVAAAAQTDDLAVTVDYGEVAQAVARVVTGPSVSLVERLAELVAGACLDFPRVQAVRVTVHKPQAPIPVPFDDVAVRITRSR